MANFSPPPTWAEPVLTTKDPATGESKASFNPAWLKWFIDLANVMTASNAGTSSGGTQAMAPNVPAERVPFGNATGVMTSSVNLLFKDSTSTITTSNNGPLNMSAGSPTVANSPGGDMTLSGGTGNGTGIGGLTVVKGGDGGSNADGSKVTIQGGAGSGAGNGGDVVLVAGTGAAAGLIILQGLPTAAPATSGALWRDAGAANVVKCVP